MWSKYFVSICCIALFSASCNSPKSNNAVSTGAGSHILVVCNNSIWESETGDSLRSFFGASMKGLSKPENEFILQHVSESELSDELRLQHNILMVETEPDIKKSKIETLKDVWANPQRVIKIKAASDTALSSLFESHKSGIIELFRQSERTVYGVHAAKTRNKTTEADIEEQLGIKMLVSGDFAIQRLADNLVFLHYDSASALLGFFITTYSYSDTSLLNPDSILGTRNRCSKLISELNKGVYTESSVNKAVTEKLLYKELLAFETRGSWFADNDSTSGSFINYTIVDAPRHRIVMFDGVVDSKGKPQRDFIRQFESIFWEAAFTDPDTKR